MQRSRPNSERTSALGSGMKNYTFVDYATQVYIAFVGLIVLGFHGTHLAAWPWLLLKFCVGSPTMRDRVQ